MSLISVCLHRLTRQGRSPVASLARRHAAAARLARLTRPAPTDTLPSCPADALHGTMAEPSVDAERCPACGWYESSLALREGLAVTEWLDTELAEDLPAWPVARWTSAQGVCGQAVQTCN